MTTSSCYNILLLSVFLGLFLPIVAIMVEILYSDGLLCISSQFHVQWHYIASFKLSMVRVFAPQKLTNAMCKGSIYYFVSCLNLWKWWKVLVKLIKLNNVLSPELSHCEYHKELQNVPLSIWKLLFYTAKNLLIYWQMSEALCIFLLFYLLI